MKQHLKDAIARGLVPGACLSGSAMYFGQAFNIQAGYGVFLFGLFLYTLSLNFRR